MKRFFSILLAVCLMTACLTGCGGNTAKSDKLSVVTTIFPVYDWTKNILGDNADNVDLTLLLSNGGDLHGYQPTAGDIVTISTCDVFIYVGGESDSWIKDVLAQATNKDMIVINLMEVLGDRRLETELTEGMEHDHGHEECTDDSHNHQYDEHIWLSLDNAQLLCREIATQLGKADPAKASGYTTACEAYCTKLAALDEKYHQAVDNAKTDTLVFADRFPCLYLTHDYELEYYAAFSGCSSESEASFATITFLTDKINELNLSAVVTIENSDKKIAQTIINTGKVGDLKVLTFNSLQSVTSGSIADGVTYLSVMTDNLEIIREALQ